MAQIDNLKAAWVLEDIAHLLELKDENIFKVKAYHRAARAIANLTEDLADIMARGELDEIPGVGKNIAEKLQELLTTGKLAYYDRLKEEIPTGLVEITNVPGVGVKMARQLYQKMGISTVDELEAAAKAHKIRELPGLGSKMELNILRGIEMLRTKGGRTIISIAYNVAEGFLGFLRSLPGVQQAESAGSTRRMKETIGDIDLVAAAEDPAAIIEVFVQHPQVRLILARGDTKASIITLMGLQVDLIVVYPDQFWSALHHFTGSREHNVRLREMARHKGLKINEYGVFRVTDNEPLPVTGEADIYRHLGLDYIPPEIREDNGEIEAAMDNTLPDLVSAADIRGDLHVHSNWSDGVNSIEQIVGRAVEMGYEYIAITDHSKSLAVAKGLSIERLRQQDEVIGRINRENKNITVLRGIEADILANGDLDYPDEILAEKDIVVASVHSGFRQEREKITDRIISAIKHEHVDILAHPTGRLIGRRDPYDVDMDRVLEAAAKYNTVLEINSSPDRLDVNDHYARKAKEYGIKIAVNTDAHEISRLAEIKYGLGTARRGWLQPGDVINTLPPADLKKFLTEHKKA
ncbi:MAG: DNA polymerase/3'-5' exonuclease PolX [Bacillota bacterium]